MILAPEPSRGSTRRAAPSQVARDELAAVVDEEAAVGVAVERDPQVGALLGILRTMNSVLRQEQFGSWFGKEPSGSK